MGMILNYLRTAPPPRPNPDTPLLPTAPAAADLPLDPAAYLKVVVDSVAPLMKTRPFPKMAGGGRALPIPMPLRTRQRRRRAVLWILEAVEKKPSKGSGKKQFAHRFAEEVVAIAEGRSKLWDKRAALHREVTLLRANSNHPLLRKLKNPYGGI
jgi:small subunit ribosomal protein S7